MLGFYCFDSAATETPLSMKQRVAKLTAEQKTAIFTAFANRVPTAHLRKELSLPEDLLDYIYNGISDIQEKCRLYMRGEVIVTPEKADEQGKVTTAAVMASVPAALVDLRQAVSPEFIDDFPGSAINEIITLMVKYSKYDLQGTWNFYKTNIIK